MKKVLFTCFMLLTTLLVGQVSPQGPSSALGIKYAPAFNAWAVKILNGTASGAGSVQLERGFVSLPDSTVINPFVVGSTLTIEPGTAVAEVVTITGVSNCGGLSTAPPLCTISATFSNAHGTGTVQSGSFGLFEAIQSLPTVNGLKAGKVVIDGSWGGTTTTLTSAAAIANMSPTVVIEDLRGAAPAYFHLAPGLTNITTPTALTTASTLTTSVTGGTIATGTTPRFCVTAVDIFGGETACSADAAATATLVDGAGSTNSYTITAAGVPVGTGIIGYRLYVSASGGATQTETVAAPANLSCTIAVASPLAGTCVPGLPITLVSLPATTNAGPPSGTSGAATAMNNAHTTAVVRSTTTYPDMLPFNSTAAAGYFPVTVTSATTLAVGYDVMGALPYPAGYFNTLGATYRICGGGVVTPSAATVAGTWTIRIGPRQNSAGTSTMQVAVPFGFVASNQWTAALSHFDFCTDVTTNATGTSGTVEGSASTFCVVVAAGNDGAGIDTCVGAFNATSSGIDLTQQGEVELTYVQTAASWTLPQLRYFTIKRIS